VRSPTFRMSVSHLVYAFWKHLTDTLRNVIYWSPGCFLIQPSLQSKIRKQMGNRIRNECNTLIFHRKVIMLCIIDKLRSRGISIYFNR
jgi:hypothetical protein